MIFRIELAQYGHSLVNKLVMNKASAHFLVSLSSFFPVLFFCHVHLLMAGCSSYS